MYWLKVLYVIKKHQVPSLVQENVVTGEYNRNFDINPFSYALNTSRALRPYDDNGDYDYYRMNYAPMNILKELKIII